MVAKIVGLASGALVASVAVWGFNAWRHVSDEDVLTFALQDHCIPYVLTGADPFDGMGRSIGVYDNVENDPRLTDGGTAIVFDGRFVASWGKITDPPLRICRVDGRPSGSLTQAFAIENDGFVTRMGDIVQVLGDLTPDTERLGDPATEVFQTLVWFEANKGEDRGNRVVMSVVESNVANVIVVRDLAD